MKLLLVVTKAEIGGAQNVVLDLARGLKNEGHDVIVAFGGGDNYLPKELEKIGISWHRFNHLSRSKNPLSGLAFAYELNNFVKEQGFELVHLHSSNALYGALGSTFTKAKSVFTFHGMSVLAPGYQQNSIFKLAYAAFFAIFARLLDGAIYLTESDRHIARSWYVRARKEAVIPNGLTPKDIDYLSRDAAREKLAKKIGADLSQKTIVGSIGRLHYQKNYEFLIKAVSNLRDELDNTTFIVIGDGSKAENLRRVVRGRELESTIHFVGAIPNAARLLPAFDVFTLVSRYEGLPITLLESLFAGVPVLTSDVGGNADVISDPDNQLFNARNGSEFQENLMRLIKNKDLRDQIIQAQNKHRSQFTFQSVLQKYIDFYKNV